MPDPALLTRGSQAATVIASGANNDTDIYCAGDSAVTVQVDMTGAATTDLSVNVYPFEADNTTVGAAPLQPKNSSGPTLAGGHVYILRDYDVSGYEKVRIRITNNNAGPQTITRASWRLS